MIEGMAMGMTRPVVRTGRKFSQVVEGARQVFLPHGFERANVDDIARVAGVSKATLYSYFPDKRLLFLEVVREECLRQADDGVAALTPDQPIRDMLMFGARRMVEYFCTPMAVSMFRLCVAEADRFPELAHGFYESGPLMGRGLLVHHMGEAVAKGDLVIDDAELAAEQFVELCKAGIFTRKLLGVDDDITPDEIDRVVTGAVDMFLARYGA
jgi:AcrR family transcriptional regulator